MLPKLLTDGKGSPPLTCEEPPDGPSIFAALAWDTAEFTGVDWGDAKLTSVVQYLRGNKYLELPQHWKVLFPDRLALPFQRSAGKEWI